MPSTTVLEIPPAEQVQIRAILRRTQYGSLLAFHLVLLCTAGRTPTGIAAFLLCSRSSVYRLVRVYRSGSLGLRLDPADGQLSVAVRMTVLMPWLMRSLDAILTAALRTIPIHPLSLHTSLLPSCHARGRCLQFLPPCSTIALHLNNA